MHHIEITREMSCGEARGWREILCHREPAVIKYLICPGLKRVYGLQELDRQIKQNERESMRKTVCFPV